MKKLIYFLILGILFTISCNESEDLNYEKPEVKASTDTIQHFVDSAFIDKYGTNVIWKWMGKYIDINYIVSPPTREVIIPALKMTQDLWIEPYEIMSEGGKKFIHKNFPIELVLVGSELRNPNGTVTLGFAEGGVRITLTELDQLDLTNEKWLNKQLHTAHHEFTHIVHQNDGLPNGYKALSSANYTGNSWTTISQATAITIGCVTPYGTTNEFEDFCELVSQFLISDKDKFKTAYSPLSAIEITQVVKDSTDALEKRLALQTGRPIEKIRSDSSKRILEWGNRVSKVYTEINPGKEIIQTKLNLAKNYYQTKFDINLETLRDTIQARVNYNLGKKK